MQGLAALPHDFGEAHPSWQPPRLQAPWATLKWAVPDWAWRHQGGGSETRARKEWGGLKVCKREKPARLGSENLAQRRLGFYPLSRGSLTTNLSPLTLTLYSNGSPPGQRNKSSCVFTSQAILGTEGLTGLRSTFEL
jgi:hypothetical protein